MPKLASEERCTGCTACQNVCPKKCIEMKSDINGFLYPNVEKQSTCIECNQCENICPIIHKKNNEYRSVAYAAFSKNENLREESSSGGIFSEIAMQILSQDGVVYGAAYDEQFEVKHCCIDRAEDLWKLRGAKYAQSNLDSIFPDVLGKLQNGKKVLFSGTPCQVAGLKAFLRKEYANLYLVDFICHGVPSPMAWKAYIEYRTRNDANGKLPIAVNLRSKVTGWSRYQYSNVFQYEDGKTYSVKSSDSLFMKLFVGDSISRPSCENCQFKGYHRDSDITLGDFWGIWDIAPEMDDNKGTSAVLIQSAKGADLWNTIHENVKVREVDLKEVSLQNPSLLYSSKANPNREEVLEKIRNGKIGKCEALFEDSKQTGKYLIQMLHRIYTKLRNIF